MESCETQSINILFLALHIPVCDVFLTVGFSQGNDQDFPRGKNSVGTTRHSEKTRQKPNCHGCVIYNSFNMFWLLIDDLCVPSEHFFSFLHLHFCAGSIPEEKS